MTTIKNTNIYIRDLYIGFVKRGLQVYTENNNIHFKYNDSNKFGVWCKVFTTPDIWSWWFNHIEDRK